MIQVRHGVFETNSSSTHSIAIPKKTDMYMQHIDFKIGNYGWENRRVTDTASYLYTAILCWGDQKYINECLGKLKEILNAHEISYSFEKPKWRYYDDDDYRWLDNGGIDHSEDIGGFVDAILDDEDMLLRYLFDGVVYTGNDNQEDMPDGCDIARDYIYVFDGPDDYKGKCIQNPYHDEENYDYFYKGN